MKEGTSIDLVRCLNPFHKLILHWGQPYKDLVPDSKGLYFWAWVKRQVNERSAESAFRDYVKGRGYWGTFIAEMEDNFDYLVRLKLVRVKKIKKDFSYEIALTKLGKKALKLIKKS
jgi:hypothetical protein